MTQSKTTDAPLQVRPIAPSFDGIALPATPSEPVEPSVRISHVSKRYGTGPVVLDDISLDIAPSVARRPCDCWRR